jgi:hypothetical protein
MRGNPRPGCSTAVLRAVGQVAGKGTRAASRAEKVKVAAPLPQVLAGNERTLAAPGCSPRKLIPLSRRRPARRATLARLSKPPSACALRGPDAATPCSLSVGTR